jgi:hypothetical protein
MPGIIDPKAVHIPKDGIKDQLKVKLATKTCNCYGILRKSCFIVHRRICMELAPCRIRPCRINTRIRSRFNRTDMPTISHHSWPLASSTPSHACCSMSSSTLSLSLNMTSTLPSRLLPPFELLLSCDFLCSHLDFFLDSYTTG